MSRPLNRNSKIGIIIPTPSKENKNIISCKKSLIQTTSDLDIEIQVIVDSGPSFRFSKSINRGIRSTSSCDGWVLVNDDCTFSEDWLGKMLDAAEKNPKAGLIGPIIIDYNGKIDHAGGFLTTSLIEGAQHLFKQGSYFQALRMPLRNALFRKSGEDIEPFHYKSLDSQNRIDFLTGACLLITKDLHDSVGEWDENYRFTWEDTDYSLRALKSGFELCLSTQSVVHHEVRATGRKWGPETWESGKVFREKWNRREIMELTRDRIGLYF